MLQGRVVWVAVALLLWASTAIGNVLFLVTGSSGGLVPINTSIPTISGTAQVGQTLSTTSNGTWTNSPTSYTYQWNSSAGGAIGGATALTYVPVAGDVGHMLTESVVAMNGSGSSMAATSAATAAVVDVIPTINTIASIPGTPQVGMSVTAIDAIWNHSVTSRVYQWKSAGVNATGTGAAMSIGVGSGPPIGIQ